MVELLPRSDKIACIEKLRPWLARIIYHPFIDRYRKNERNPLNLASAEEDALTAHSAPESEIPENQLEADANQQQLLCALQTLNEDQRAVVLLHDVEGYTLTELETILASPQGTLKSRLSRARIHNSSNVASYTSQRNTSLFYLEANF